MLREAGPNEEDPLQQMMKDQFGNYVVQKVLEVCDERQREMLLARVRVQLGRLAQALEALGHDEDGDEDGDEVECLVEDGTGGHTAETLAALLASIDPEIVEEALAIAGLA